MQLIEISTGDEVHDNVTAMWVLKAPARADSQYRLRHRLYWLTNGPYPAQLARCVAIHVGNGSQPGRPRPRGVRKFMVEFKGGPLEKLLFGAKPEAVFSSPRSTSLHVFTEAMLNDVPGH